MRPIYSNRIKACRRRRATLNVSATVRPHNWNVWSLGPEIGRCLPAIARYRLDANSSIRHSIQSRASNSLLSLRRVVSLRAPFPLGVSSSAAYRQSARGRLKTKLSLCVMQPRHLQNANSLSESKTTAQGESGRVKVCGNTDKWEYPFHGTPAPQGSTAASSAYHTISCI